MSLHLIYTVLVALTDAAHVDHVNHIDHLNHGGAQVAIGHGDALTQHQIALQEHEARVQVSLFTKLKGRSLIMSPTHVL